MKALLCQSRFAKAFITDQHDMCSYGQPVLLLHGQPHGPYDIFPSGMSGEEIVQTFLRAEPPFPWDGWWGKSKEARKLAKEFLDVSEETAL